MSEGVAGGTKRRRRKFKLPKTSIMFLFGIVIIVNEALPTLRRPPNTALIFAGLALMGIPVVQGTENKLAQSIRDALTEEIPEKEDPGRTGS